MFIYSDHRKGTGQEVGIDRKHALTGGVALHLNDALGLFAGLSRIEGPHADSHLHRGSRHSDSLAV